MDREAFPITTVMYEYIIGKYKGLYKDYIVIENNNIGYKIFTSGSTISNMPKIDDEVKLYIEQIVREDFLGLYGFLKEEELAMFKLLLTINGVGAKAALSLLSISNVNNLKYSIIVGDEKHITRAPGIGKKTAQRIILELKDKFKGEEEVASNDLTDYDGAAIENNKKEASEALMALGYTEKEISKIMKDIKEYDSVEKIIKECLRLLMNY